MLKQVADASGPVVVLTYFINNVIPVVQPIIIFATACAGLAWYAVRFYAWFKYDKDID
jgi:hypothetical protein